MNNTDKIIDDSLEKDRYCYIPVTFSNLNNFEGRVSRREYWCFIASFSLPITILVFIAMNYPPISESGFVLVAFAISLLNFYIGLAISARRLHDVGVSGWWQLVGFIPFLSILMLYFYFKDSDEGDNSYGCEPKE